MSRIILIAIIIAALFQPTGFASASPALSSNDLIDGAKDYNGLEVVYIGEAIGDIMVRFDHAWVNVNDGSNAISVWAKSEDTDDINLLGSYVKKGAVVKVFGEFHRACPEHGGDMDIHAADIEVLQKGYEIRYENNTVKMIVAYVLFIAALFCLGFTVKKFAAK